MSSSDEPREQAVPSFHEILQNAQRPGEKREAREAAGEAGAPPPPPEQPQHAVSLSERCWWFHWLVDWVLAWRCSLKKNKMQPCKGYEQNCPCVGGVEGGHGHCVEARIPDIRPCVQVHWGDSKCDCLEGNDVEVLCITVCNCYSNVTFNNLTISYVLVTDAGGQAVGTLPDGTPSVEARPLGPICFGDLPPCREGDPSCVSREVVVISRGAKAGAYAIQLGAICFSVTNDYDTEACFRFEICGD